MGAFAKAPTYVETCKPLIPPASAVPRHPPLARGALVRCFHYHRTNDTGHRRGRNDLQKIIVRNWPRPLAADTGHKKAPLRKGAGKNL